MLKLRSKSERGLSPSYSTHTHTPQVQNYAAEHRPSTR